MPRKRDLPRTRWWRAGASAAQFVSAAGFFTTVTAVLSLVGLEIEATDGFWRGMSTGLAVWLGGFVIAALASRRARLAHEWESSQRIDQGRGDGLPMGVWRVDDAIELELPDKGLVVGALLIGYVGLLLVVPDSRAPLLTWSVGFTFLVVGTPYLWPRLWCRSRSLWRITPQGVERRSLGGGLVAAEEVTGWEIRGFGRDPW
ncbi:MAG: hypothetical protein WAW88_03655, partial [Nocardioides sp.]